MSNKMLDKRRDRRIALHAGGGSKCLALVCMHYHCRTKSIRELIRWLYTPKPPDLKLVPCWKMKKDNLENVISRNLILLRSMEQKKGLSAAIMTVYPEGSISHSGAG